MERERRIRDPQLRGTSATVSIAGVLENLRAAATPEEIARRKAAGEKMLAAKAKTPLLEISIAELRQQAREDMERP